MQLNSGGLGWGLGCDTTRPPVSASPPHYRGGTWIAPFWK